MYGVCFVCWCCLRLLVGSCWLLVGCWLRLSVGGWLLVVDRMVNVERSTVVVGWLFVVGCWLLVV